MLSLLCLGLSLLCSVSISLLVSSPYASLCLFSMYLSIWLHWQSERENESLKEHQTNFAVCQTAFRKNCTIERTKGNRQRSERYVPISSFFFLSLLVFFFPPLFCLFSYSSGNIAMRRIGRRFWWRITSATMTPMCCQWRAILRA